MYVIFLPIVFPRSFPTFHINYVVCINIVYVHVYPTHIKNDLPLKMNIYFLSFGFLVVCLLSSLTHNLEHFCVYHFQIFNLQDTIFDVFQAIIVHYLCADNNFVYSSFVRLINFHRFLFDYCFFVLVWSGN